MNQIINHENFKEHVKTIKEVVKKSAQSRYDFDEGVQEISYQVFKEAYRFEGIKTKPEVTYFLKRMTKTRMLNFYKKERRFYERHFSDKETINANENHRNNDADIQYKNKSMCQNPEFLIEYTQLKNILENFPTTQPNEKKYIQEALNNSKGLVEFWEEIRSKNNRFLNYEFIPPHTICKYIGMNANQYTRFKIKLKRYLSNHEIIN